MKIKRIVNNVELEFELSKQELHKAWRENDSSINSDEVMKYLETEFSELTKHDREEILKNLSISYSPCDWMNNVDEEVAQYLGK